MLPRASDRDVMRRACAQARAVHAEVHEHVRQRRLRSELMVDVQWKLVK